MTRDSPPPDFKSPQELTQLLDSTSRRLHYINRVSGESNFVWHLAELIRAVGQMAPLIDDHDISAEFGDGWTSGKIAAPDQTDRLIALLRARLAP